MILGSWRSDPETGKWHVFITGKTECVAGTVVEVVSQGGKCTKLIVQHTIKPIRGGNLYHCKSFENSEVRPIYKDSLYACKVKPEAEEIGVEISTEVSAKVGIDELNAALGLD